MAKNQTSDIHMRSFPASLVLTFFILFSAVSPDAAAESIKKADPDDIKMLLNAASGMNSAFWASLIGETRGRVYIEYETAVHASSLFSKEMKRVVYWLPRTEITDEQLTQFKTYKDRYEALRQTTNAK